MADPLTALGIASNVIQLISFTSGLVSKGHEIYKSTDGKLIEHLELETVTDSLQELSKGLMYADIGPVTELSKTDEQLLELSGHCNRVALELLGIVQGLQAKGESKAWRSFRQALNSVWHEEKIDGLSKRLEQYRRQIDTTLLVSLREQLSHSTSRRPNTKEHHESQSMEEIKAMQKDLLSAVAQNNWRSQNQKDMSTFSSIVSSATKVQRELLMKAQIMEKLRFWEMDERFERIEEAYTKTFDWIFRDEGQFVIPEVSPLSMQFGSNDEAPPTMQKLARWNNFSEWLQGNESLYWVTGKPGSGKSTLMKYLYNNQQTLRHLHSWARGSSLVTAGFFFWNSGISIQMSKMGLLRSLLYQSIGSRAHLIPAIFPERWRSYQAFGGDLHPWTWAELLHGLSMAVQDQSLKFFYTIDGLDEFDGDCDELANFVLEYSTKPNIKLCVASRPWLVFEDAFERKPSLRLEDLTRGDIHIFVSSKLGGNNVFRTLARLKPMDAERLINEVTAKASGVFLWVRLVILSLLEGLRDGDGIEDLQDRLLLLPSDLEELFSKILNSLSPRYLEQASKLFQLINAAHEDHPLTLLSLAFADDGFNQAMNAKVKTLSVEEITFKTEMMRRRLNSRCKGLLEAPVYSGESSKAKVEYLHRTVKDYLQRPDIWEYILSKAPSSYNPNLMLCGAYIQLLKAVKMNKNVLRPFETMVNIGIKYSLRLQSQFREIHVSTLNEIDKVCNELFAGVDASNSGKSWLEALWTTQNQFPARDGIGIAHWTAFVSKQKGRQFFEHSFFEFALDYPLYCIVEDYLKSGFKPTVQPGYHSTTLLDRATFHNDKRMILILHENHEESRLRRDDQYLATEAIPSTPPGKASRKSWLSSLIGKRSSRRSPNTLPLTPPTDS